MSDDALTALEEARARVRAQVEQPGSVPKTPPGWPVT